MKNNAFIQEQRMSSRTREDSDEVDEHQFDQSIEENDSVFHENCKNSEKTQNDRKLLAAKAGGVIGGNSQRPKNLEVSWHHSKSGSSTTKTSTSPILGSPDNDSQGKEVQNSSSQNTETGGQSTANNWNPSGVPHESHPHSMVHFQQTTPPDSADMSLAQQMTSSNSSGSSTTITKKKRHTWRSVSMSSTTESVFSSKKGRKKQVVNGASNQQNSSLLPPPNVKGHQKVIKNPSRTYSVRSSALSNMSQPRTHSVRAISRAKIKTIKLTITVICCYIVCSTPFMAALLWSAFDPYAKEHPFFYGPTFTILTLLASLNSCANAFIVLFFNPNLIQSFVKGTFGRVCHHFGQHPSSLIGSQRKQVFNNRKPGTANLSQRPNTSVTGLSPLMNRSSPPKEYGNNRFNGGQDGMELIPSATEEAGNVEKVVAVVPLRSSMSSRNGNNYPRGGDSEAAPVETSFIGI